jgi:hypothetical protein
MNEPDELYNRLVDLGEKWAELNGDASLYEESKHSVRAELALRFFQDAKSAAKAEMMAEADKRYTDHIRAMVKARTQANIAKVNFDSLRVWVDLMRTKEATKRAEATMLK